MGQMLLLALFLLQATGEQEYIYDTSSVQKSKNHGQRLVGAGQGDHTHIPFIVAYDPNAKDSKRRYASCTGSLITSRWIISAAHCDDLLSKEKHEKQCVKLTSEGQSYRYNKTTGKYRCKFLSEGHLEIVSVERKGRVWVGTSDLNNREEKANEDFFTAAVKRFIRHVKSYRGLGKYGKYGGYDITLIELEKPVPEKFGSPICLPSKSFQDSGIKANIAGYGNYYRLVDENKELCQTDEYGRNKFHMCAAAGDVESVCQKGLPPVSADCAKFFSKINATVSGEFEEIKIVDEETKKEEFCFASTSPNPDSRGWCETDMNFYEFKAHEEKGWGFCGKDCYLGKLSSKKASGVLRDMVGVDVLADNLCNVYLKESSLGLEMKVKPKILCVAKFRAWRTQLWKKKGNQYELLVNYTGSDISRQHFGDQLSRLEDYKGPTGYVTSPGTCHGDSGGPLYIKQDKKFVLTGVVSGGRGEIGACGGINNPVHYTRLKRFTKWIKEILGSEAKKLCWVGKKSANETANASYAGPTTEGANLLTHVIATLGTASKSESTAGPKPNMSNETAKNATAEKNDVPGSNSYSTTTTIAISTTTTTETSEKRTTRASDANIASNETKSVETTTTHRRLH